jgi:hypothetical protein
MPHWEIRTQKGFSALRFHPFALLTRIFILRVLADGIQPFDVDMRPFLPASAEAASERRLREALLELPPVKLVMSHEERLTAMFVLGLKNKQCLLLILLTVHHVILPNL